MTSHTPQQPTPAVAPPQPGPGGLRGKPVPTSSRPLSLLLLLHRLVRLRVRRAHAVSAAPSVLWLLTSAPSLRLLRCFHFLA